MRMKLIPTGFPGASTRSAAIARISRLLIAASTAGFSCIAAAQTTADISIARTLFTPWEGFRATVGEPTDDSRRAVLGTKQDASGNIVHWSSDVMGVSSLFANERSASDTRMADLALNGTPALIAI